MTGPGLHLWKDGERITAGDIATHVERQGVVPFSSASTRAASYPDPAAGAVSYLRDIDEYQLYDGIDWRSIFTLTTTYYGPWSASLTTTTTLAAGVSADVCSATGSLKYGQWYWASGCFDFQSTSTNYVVASGALYVDGEYVPGHITGQIDDQNRTVYGRQWVFQYQGSTGGSKTLKLVAKNHDSTNSLNVIQSHTRLVMMAIGVTPTEAVF